MNNYSRAEWRLPKVRSYKRLARGLAVIENEFDQLHRILSPFWALQSAVPVMVPLAFAGVTARKALTKQKH